MTRYFILVDKEIYETNDIQLALENAKHWQVAKTTVKGQNGKPCEISTAYLGQDGQMFETIIFGGGTSLEGLQFREQSYEAAMNTHASLVDGQRKARASHMRRKRDRLAAKCRT